MTASPGEQTRTGWTVDDSTFGARLALVRQRMNWNIKQAATECGVPPATWALWERGGAEPRRMERVTGIAQRSGCDLMWLAFGSKSGASALRLSSGARAGQRRRPAVRPSGASTKRAHVRPAAAAARPDGRRESAGTTPSLPRPAILPRRVLA